MINVDFKFDFKSAISNEYKDMYQSIAYIAEGIDSNSSISIENAIRELIEINSTVLANVLEKYNAELLNEIEL